jgi:hypothetical protein
MTARWSGVLVDDGGNALVEEDLEVEMSAGLLTTIRRVVSRSDVSDGCS